MNPSDRYDTSSLPEAQFEPGSRGRVLKNLLHITHKREMDVTEAGRYALVIPNLAERFESDHRFTAVDICEIHRLWLGDIYTWAGQYRQVNMSKDGFDFAMARHVPQLMQELEKDFLAKYTPCTFATEEEIITALSVVHTELMLLRAA
jgi:cell filamentation protein